MSENKVAAPEKFYKKLEDQRGSVDTLDIPTPGGRYLLLCCPLSSWLEQEMNVGEIPYLITFIMQKGVIEGYARRGSVTVDLTNNIHPSYIAPRLNSVDTQDARVITEALNDYRLGVVAYRRSQ